MSHGEMTASTRPSGEGLSRYEVLEGICSIFNVADNEREHYHAAIADVLNRSRPESLIYTPSTSSASITPSTRRSQLSISSSRTSYCSSVSRTSLAETLNSSGQGRVGSAILPSTLTDDDSLSIDRHKRHVSTSDINGFLSPGTDATLPRNSQRMRCCPWCDYSFTRPHDFKKHVNRYCCGRQFWVCRNPDCSNSASQELQAKKHRTNGENSMCNEFGYAKIELECKRKHFGCRYCAKYFDDLDKFLEHLGQDCRPDRVRGLGHQSDQIIGLLQQDSLLPRVEALCLQLWGDRDAYRRIYWTWRKDIMARKIEMLEYGPKAQPSQQNPGIAIHLIDSFLREFITPSRAVHEKTELKRQLSGRQPNRPRSRAELMFKPLPPPPQSEQQVACDEEMRDVQVQRLGPHGRTSQNTGHAGIPLSHHIHHMQHIRDQQVRSNQDQQINRSLSDKYPQLVPAYHPSHHTQPNMLHHHHPSFGPPPPKEQAPSLADHDSLFDNASASFQWEDLSNVVYDSTTTDDSWDAMLDLEQNQPGTFDAGSQMQDVAYNGHAHAQPAASFPAYADCAM